MRYENARGERRVCEGILGDPGIPEEAKAPIRDRFEICRAECDRMRAAGCKPKKISDDFGTAKLWHLAGPYSMLCAFSHNDLNVIALRHQGEMSMVYKQEVAPELVRSIVTSGLMVLMDATDQFGRIARFPEGVFESVYAEMGEKWLRVVDGDGTL